MCCHILVESPQNSTSSENNTPSATLNGTGWWEKPTLFIDIFGTLPKNGGAPSLNVFTWECQQFLLYIETQQSKGQTKKVWSLA